MVRPASKVTVTVAVWVSTRRDVTPGTLSNAFSIVMLHAGQVMFSTCKATSLGVLAKVNPIDAVRTKPRRILRIGNSLQEPAYVIGEEQ